MPLTPGELLNLLQCRAADGKLLPMFVLRTGERRVTFQSQQWRALNLVQALDRERVLPKEASVAVIGGGIAGLTAAAGAALLGYKVTLYERQPELLHLQKESLTRYVHPNIYEWPNKGWDEVRTHVPILSWTANSTGEVVREVLRTFRKIKETKRIDVLSGKRSIRLEPSGPNSVKVSAGTSKTHAVAILAVGFGLEKAVGDAPRISYWRNDDLGQPLLTRVSGKKTHLVSGVGDGGLIDLLRLTIDDFRQEEIVERVFDESQECAALQDWLRHVREKAFAEIRSRDAADEYLNDQYGSLNESGSNVADNVRLGFGRVRANLKEMRRTDTRVTLHGASPSFVTAGAAILHSFLAYALYLGPDGRPEDPGFEYQHGALAIERKQNEDVYSVTIGSGKSEDYHRVVVRHGCVHEDDKVDGGNVTEIVNRHLEHLDHLAKEDAAHDYRQDLTGLEMEGNGRAFWAPIEVAPPSSRPENKPPSANGAGVTGHKGRIISMRRDYSFERFDWFERFRRGIETDMALESSMLYCGPGLAENWRRMVTAPGFYRKLETLVNELVSKASVKLDRLAKKKVTVVDLGIGDSRKADAFLSLYHQMPTVEELNYVAVDISQDMLISALHSRAAEQNDALFAYVNAKHGRISAINSSFTHMHRHKSTFAGPDRGSHHTMFLLLGNTLGNEENDTATLKQIAGAMRPDDVLVCEVQLLEDVPPSVGEMTDLLMGDAEKRAFYGGPFRALNYPEEHLRLIVTDETPPEPKACRTYHINVRLGKDHGVSHPGLAEPFTLRKDDYRVHIVRKYFREGLVGLLAGAGLEVHGAPMSLPADGRLWGYVIASKRTPLQTAPEPS